MKKVTPPTPSAESRRKASLHLWMARENIVAAAFSLQGTPHAEALAEVIQRVTQIKEQINDRGCR